MGAARWQFWIDRGGTFTDLVGRAPSGELVVRKVLSQQPGRPGDPAVRAIRQVLGLAEAAPLPADLIEEVRLGTTVATNALLERQGASTLLLVNQGFADALLIGDQHRPDLFALRIERPLPLYGRVIEVEGRLAADGRELEPLQLDQALAQQLRLALDDGFRSVAVVLLHGYRHPRHEQRLGHWLHQFGFGAVALSHQVSPLPRLVPRGHTTVLEAYVAPVLSGYLDQLRQALGQAVQLRVMQSSGGLIAPRLLRAKDTILSGPAAGLVGAAATSAAAGFNKIVGFDMGGTSTDVCYCDGPWERRELAEVAGFALQAPMLAIHTVAAGGGSLIQFDGQRLQVGPASAGADPGPACYRAGGPLTISDANLLLGRLQPEWFPAVFGPQGDLPLDCAVVWRQFEQLAATVLQFTGQRRSPEQLAEGALAIAIERMAEAIRRISIQQGHDIRQAALCCFGGAGGQHACALAEALGIERVLLHPLAGVLSAYGLGLAEERHLQELVVRQPLSEALLAELELQSRELIAAARRQAGLAPEQGRVELRLLLRSAGSDTTLPLRWDRAEALRQAFAEQYRLRYGYGLSELDGALPWPVLERLTVELVHGGPGGNDETGGNPGQGAEPISPQSRPLTPAAAARVDLFLAGAWQRLPLWQREHLVAGAVLEGPALIVEATGTNLLLAGWRAHLLADGALLFQRCGCRGSEHGPSAASERLPAPVPPEAEPPPGAAPADPVLLELYNHRFAAIAEQMGTRLQQTSASVNIKERLDFSCAVFTAAGALVANAPHIPVHLGSMGDCVAALLAAVGRGQRPALAPGDVYVTNDPYNGGTHLPDLTVITPVFAGDGTPAPLFFVASRGHHADVGGITPGSMPPHSHTIAEEGLLLDLVPVLEGGRWPEAAWRQRLAAGPWPVRNPEQLIADLQAQVAANQQGVEQLRALIARHGLAELQAYMGHVQAHAAEAVRRVIDRLDDGPHCVELDDGSVIAVAVRVDHARRRVTVDFSGTSAQQAGNFNAPLAITKAVVLYVFRCLVGEEIPLNAGCFEPIDLVVPPGSLLHPQPPAAVVAGNVETSQVVANALFAALGVMAAAQGTMNNLSFGDGQLQYYETICGGSGAGRSPAAAGFAGSSAVQCHMTNSRLTDPEILEERFPVRLVRFAIRRGSGGLGRWPGGDGVVRQLRFLAPLTAAILANSRRVAPFGLAGGAAGQPGRNSLLRADGRREYLAACAQMAMEAGDELLIETPGGGGYGAAMDQGAPR